MKAAYMERHGGPEVLKYGDLPDPVPGPASRRRHPCRQRQRCGLEGARRRLRADPKFPYVLGRDFSGMVSAVARASTDFRSAIACSACATPGQEGTYAEKIAIKAAIVAKKPAGISHVDAAALALPGSPRWSSSRTR